MGEKGSLSLNVSNFTQKMLKGQKVEELIIFVHIEIAGFHTKNIRLFI